MDYEEFKKVVGEEFSKNLKDYRKVKENVIFCLVNTEQNHDLLLSVPNRQFNDLSVIYRWVVSVNGSFQSKILTNEIAQNAGLTEEQLFEAAMLNTRRIMKPTIRNLFGCFTGQAENLLEESDDGGVTPALMYIISNRFNIHGAASILDTEILDILGEELGSFFILPSSIHEMLAVPDNGLVNPNYLRQIVKEVNSTEVSAEEKLSDNVYYYDKRRKMVVLAE